MFAPGRPRFAIEGNSPEDRVLTPSYRYLTRPIAGSPHVGFWRWKRPKGPLPIPPRQEQTSEQTYRNDYYRNRKPLPT